MEDCIIEEELKEAEKYRHNLELDECTGKNNFKLLKLTRDNVARVEAMISTDSSYQSENKIGDEFKNCMKY